MTKKQLIEVLKSFLNANSITLESYPMLEGNGENSGTYYYFTCEDASVSIEEVMK